MHVCEVLYGLRSKVFIVYVIRASRVVVTLIVCSAVIAILCCGSFFSVPIIFSSVPVSFVRNYVGELLVEVMCFFSVGYGSSISKSYCFPIVRWCILFADPAIVFHRVWVFFCLTGHLNVPSSIVLCDFGLICLCLQIVDRWGF